MVELWETLGAGAGRRWLWNHDWIHKDEKPWCPDLLAGHNQRLSLLDQVRSHSD